MGSGRWLMVGLLAVAFATAAGADDKKIDVRVSGGAIVVPDSEARIKRVDQSIIWTLSSAGASFPSDGIVFKDAPPGTFTNCRPLGGDRMFQCHKAKHASGARYKYDVNVLQSGSRLPTLDPFVNME